MTFSRIHAASKKKTVRGRELPTKTAVWEMVLMPKFRPGITESVAKQVILATHQFVESVVSCSVSSPISQLRRSCLPRSAKHPSLRGTGTTHDGHDRNAVLVVPEPAPNRLVKTCCESDAKSQWQALAMREDPTLTAVME
ncbi:unnamed protein product [Polarella glacialis]|uniref:Uncharacterized protein n=1 Tax=Polarella glacialis TaxID=89957 RepID=A0A813EHM5_POLGL|nr:unnamed protein product [Polarella glacialis]CAE8601746.1 unnamed protein product [Polarella glacialis]